MTSCKITFFAGLADKLGKTHDYIENNWKVGDDAKTFFKKKYPILESLPFSVAINMELADIFPENEVNEIMLLPPFAGG